MPTWSEEDINYLRMKQSDFEEFLGSDFFQFIMEECDNPNANRKF